MAYQDERETRLKRERSKQAIALAMQSRWREAVAVNQHIIENFPNDIEAYNRLGKAYMELGEYLQARGAYSRAVEIAPYNIIAKKNLERLSRLGEVRAGSEDDTGEVEIRQFIEEAGKAGTVNLYHLAPKEVLARVMAGDKVHLEIGGSNLVVKDAHGQYLGQVEPKQGQRLVRLIQGGNQYTAAIISLTEDMVSVIVREVYQHPSQAGQLSFPPKGVDGLPAYLTDRIPRPALEYEEEATGGLGYTIIDGEGTEILRRESLEDVDAQGDEIDNEE